MATINIREYSGNQEHGCTLTIDGEQICDVLFASPGFSSQMACQQAERHLIEKMERYIGVDDLRPDEPCEHTITVDGTFQRPYLVREYLQARGYLAA